jgi:6-phosphogluconolactonase (cycloisomerase 2 family)
MLRIIQISAIVFSIPLLSTCRVQTECRTFDSSCNLMASILFLPAALVPRYVYVTDTTNGLVRPFRIQSGTNPLLASTTVALTGASAIAVDPRGRFLFAGSPSGLTAFTINKGTGELGSGVTNASIGNPLSIAVDKLGRYVTASSLSGVLACKLTETSSILADCVTDAGITSAHQLALSNDGRFLYFATSALNSVISSYALDVSTLALTVNGGNATGASGVTPNTPSALFVNTTGSHLYLTYSVLSGTNSLVWLPINADGTIGTASGAYANLFFGLAVDPLSRYAFIANPSNSALLAVTRNADGSLTPAPPAFLASTGGTVTPQRVAVDSNGSLVYYLNSGTQQILVFSIGAAGFNPASTTASPGNDLVVASVPEG